jgi:hypothetical protein
MVGLDYEGKTKADEDSCREIAEKSSDDIPNWQRRSDLNRYADMSATLLIYC